MLANGDAADSATDHFADEAPVLAQITAAAGCGSRLRFLATIEDPPVVTKVLTHLGLPTTGPALMPARPPPQPDSFDFA